MGVARCRGDDGMIRKTMVGVITALLILIICSSQVLGDNGTSISDDISLHQIQFIKNVGQVDNNILFQVKSADISFDFTKGGLIVSGLNKTCGNCSEDLSVPVLITIKGADDSSDVRAVDQLPGNANFLIGQNESEWHKDVPWYGKILYEEILPGINLTYTGKDGVLKREFEVGKGVDPSVIRLVYSGAGDPSIADDGSLLVNTSFGTISELPPYSYQMINGVQVPVDSSYKIYNESEIGYSVTGYDPAYALIIDPYLEYSTLIGGSLEDYGMDIKVDKTGNAYITGYTSSCDYPLLNPLNMTSPIRFNGSHIQKNRDVFITKIGSDQNGNATILLSTYIGGSADDFGRGIAVDSMNNIYITGDTFSSDFPVLYPFANGQSLHGSDDAFVLKINSNLNSIQWSDYLGGNFADQANDIALDSLDAVYLTGKTVGNNQYKNPDQVFPVTDNAYQTSPNPDATLGDAFATKISADGKKIEYSSYISGSGEDSGNGIDVDGQGCAYIFGTTTSPNLLPSGVPGYQKVLKGSQDAFLFKMNFQAGVPPVYATYLGGSTGYDYGQAVAVDTAGQAFVTGATASYIMNGAAADNFPVTNGAMQTKKGWPYDAFEKDAFVTKFNFNGDNLVYSTFLGGTKDDWGYGIDIDNTGRAFVTGYSSSSQIPSSGLVNPLKGASGSQDGFLTVVNPAGSAAEFSTFFGGYRDDISRAVAIGPDGDGSTSYVTGYTNSPGIMDCLSSDCVDMAFPELNWIYQFVYGGGNKYNGGKNAGSFDTFVMKFGKATIEPSISANRTCGSGDPNLLVKFTDTTTGSGNILNRIWNFGDNSQGFDSGPLPTTVDHDFTKPGTYDVTLTIYTYTDRITSPPVRITVCNQDMSVNYTVPGFDNAEKTQDPIYVPWKQAVTFTAEPKNFTPSLYKWQFGDGTANQTLDTPSTTHAFANVGTYRVNLTATLGTCCDNSIKQGSRNISVLAPPSAQFSNNTPGNICSPLTYNFEDRSGSDATHSAPTSWQWNFGDNTDNATVQNSTHTYGNPGIYTVTLTVSNVAGSSTIQKTNLISVAGDVLAGFSASPLNGTAPLDVQFTDQSLGLIEGYTWKFGDDTPDETKQNPSHTYEKSGLYPVTLTVRSVCGNTATSLPTYIVVNGNMTPKVLFGNNTAPYSPAKVNGTSPLHVSFIADTTDGTLIDTATWDFGDGNKSVMSRPTGWANDNLWCENTSIYYYDARDYTPTISITNKTYGQGYAAYQDQIGVYKPLKLSFSISPEPPGVAGQDFTFTDTSHDNLVKWDWDFNDGTPDLQGNPVRHNFTEVGTYDVKLTGWNKYRAEAEVTNQVEINSAQNTGTLSFVPNNITLINGSQNDRQINLLLDRADFGLNSFKIRIDLSSINNSTIKNWYQRPFWIPDQYSSYELSNASGSMTISGLNMSWSWPTGSRNISLGNISLYGGSPGSSVLSYNSSCKTDSLMYNSHSMILTLIQANLTTCAVPVLPGGVGQPRDIWPTNVHDGLVDDFDGNGVVNTKDVQVFFNAWSKGALDNLSPGPFDYNHNNRFDPDDITTYFNLIFGKGD